MNAPSSVPQKRRWPGLLLSLLVPGFGIIRAGLPWRGAGWFLGLQLLALIAGLSFAVSVVPLWLSILVLVVALVAQIWMLCDSFRPGRMTVPLWLLFIGLLAAIIWFPSPFSLVARAFKIPTGAMEPTLLGSRPASTPDHVIVDRLSYRFGSPRRGDLIVFSASQIGVIRQSEGEEEVFFFKRLVGLPGERIRIADGKVFADGRLLGESDGIPPFIYTAPVGGPSLARRDGQDFVVGPNEYFALGDNSPKSYDSRHFGGVPASDVYGKVTMIYYPFSRAGRLSTK